MVEATPAPILVVPATPVPPTEAAATPVPDVTVEATPAPTTEVAATPAPEPTPTPAVEEIGAGFPVGAIIAIVLGVIAVMAVGGFLFLRNRRRLAQA